MTQWLDKTRGTLLKWAQMRIFKNLILSAMVIYSMDINTLQSNQSLAKEKFGGRKPDQIRQATYDFFSSLSKYLSITNYGSPLLPAMDEVVDPVKDPEEQANAFIQMLHGIADTRESGIDGGKIKDNICMTLGYKILTERMAYPNVLGCIIQAGLLDDLFSAISRIAPNGEGMKKLVERSSNDSFFVFNMENETQQSSTAVLSGENRVPGSILIDRALDKQPDLALSVDVSGMLEKIDSKSPRMDFRNHQEKEATARVIKKSLAAWLDNDKNKPYKLHLLSGPKQAAENVISGLVRMKSLGMLDEQDMVSLTTGKRGARLDKTLARAESLIDKNAYNRKSFTHEEVMEFRAWARKVNFTQHAQDKLERKIERAPLI